MSRPFMSFLVAASLACVAAPGFSQDKPEEPRTTYQVTMLRFAPGAADRWSDLMENHYKKAALAAGLPPTEVHWIMDGQWNIMLIRKLPRGLATLDTHQGPETKAFMKALAAQEGGEEAVKKLNEENEKLVTESMRFYTHTHP